VSLVVRPGLDSAPAGWSPARTAMTATDRRGYDCAPLAGNPTYADGAVVPPLLRCSVRVQGLPR